MEIPSRTVALVDDHVLFRKGILELIEGFDGYEVVFDTSSGEDLLSYLQRNSDLPDVVILDVNMPKVDGFQVCKEISTRFPHIRILALSMLHDELSIIKMIKSGAHGYVLKDIHPNELRNVLNELCEKGQFYNEMTSAVMVNTLRSPATPDEVLTDREIVFLRHCASELTYKEIADKMNLSPRTIDGYRETLFRKLGVKSRVGLVLYGIKEKLIAIG